MTEEVVNEYALPLRTAAGRWAAAEVLRRALPADAEQRVARYRELPHEFLVICGDSDTVAGLDSSRRFCEKAPRARLLEVPDCAHVPQEERPELVAAALEEFFTR
jgi:pimeloyl-ACP methyl ester carboxylesterase